MIVDKYCNSSRGERNWDRLYNAFENFGLVREKGGMMCFVRFYFVRIKTGKLEYERKDPSEKTLEF